MAYSAKLIIIASMITLCIHQSITDPYFNLAAEEYFLKNYEEDFFMLWRSEPTVVVGKHQNALAEINHQFVNEHHISVARRLSGGGTVFHDLGNLNFTFIRTVEKIQDVNFKVFTHPIVEALRKAGVEASANGRNDLVIDGKKISGNAEHVHKNRVLHHGTLLYNSKLNALKGTLNVDLSRFEDKSVQSKRSEVTNIAAYLSSPMRVEEFGNLLFSEISNLLPGAKVYELTQADRQAIQQLSDEKYRTWDWIYGYSPRYRFSQQLETEKGVIHLSLTVEKGLIAEASISGAISEDLSLQLVKVIIGSRHELSELKSALITLNKHLLQEDISPEELVKALF